MYEIITKSPYLLRWNSDSPVSYRVNKKIAFALCSSIRKSKRIVIIQQAKIKHAGQTSSEFSRGAPQYSAPAVGMPFYGAAEHKIAILIPIWLIRY